MICVLQLYELLYQPVLSNGRTVQIIMHNYVRCIPLNINLSIHHDKMSHSINIKVGPNVPLITRPKLWLNVQFYWLLKIGFFLTSP